MNKLKSILSDKMNFLRFGLISLTVGILLDQFGSEAFIYHFLSGLFIGLSVPLNICGTYRIARSTHAVGKEEFL